MHRYAIFTALYEPHMGGVEVFSKNLANQLASEGNEVLVVTSQLGEDPDHEVTPEGVEVVRLPAHVLMGGRLPIPKKNAAYRRMWRRIQDWAPDRVLVSAYFYGHSLEGLRLASEVGAKAVLLDHSSSWLSLDNPAADLVLRGYQRAMAAEVRGEAPIVAGVSEKSARWLSELGLDASAVINNAVDAEAYRALSSGRDFRAELGIPADRFLAVYVGRLVPDKNPLLAVAAAEQLPEASFVVAGAGPEEGAVAEAADRLDNLDFVGRLSQADVSALLSQADCLVFPTAYPEGMPTVMLEAAAWGVRPVMPADVAGAEDAFGGTDILCALPALDADAVTAAVAALMAEKPEERAKAVEATRAHIESSCGWAHTARQLDDAFNAR